MTVVLNWLRVHLGKHDKDDILPPSPKPLEMLSDEERERHRREITEREATLRMLEAKARLKGRRPW